MTLLTLEMSRNFKLPRMHIGLVMVCRVQTTQRLVHLQKRSRQNNDIGQTKQENLSSQPHDKQQTLSMSYSSQTSHLKVGELPGSIYQTEGRAVIKAAESGAAFPLKRRDQMLDYTLTLMAGDGSEDFT